MNAVAYRGEWGQGPGQDGCLQRPSEPHTRRQEFLAHWSPGEGPCTVYRGRWGSVELRLCCEGLTCQRSHELSTFSGRRGLRRPLQAQTPRASARHSRSAASRRRRHPDPATPSPFPIPFHVLPLEYVRTSNAGNCPNRLLVAHEWDLPDREGQGTGRMPPEK